MKKQIIKTFFGIILMISLIGMVSAASQIKITIDEDEWDVNFFAGETIVRELMICNEYDWDKEIYLTYKIEGNEFDLDGIDFEFSDSRFDLGYDDCRYIDFTIISQSDYKPDSFTITIEAEDSAIEDEDDGGDNHWIYETCKWSCKSWGACSGGTQIRKCIRETLYCRNIDNKPIEEQTCEEVIDLKVEEVVVDEIVVDVEKNDSELDVDDDKNTPLWKWILIIIILIILIIIILIIIYKSKKDEPEPKSEDENKDESDEGDDDNYEPIEGLDFLS